VIHSLLRIFNVKIKISVKSKDLTPYLLSLFIVGYGGEGARPDSSFKGIHQHEYEVHQKDTIKHDTILKREKTQVESVRRPNRGVETIINLTLMNIILITLVIVLVIFLILHRRYRLGKE